MIKTFCMLPIMISEKLQDEKSALRREMKHVKTVIKTLQGIVTTDKLYYKC